MGSLLTIGAVAPTFTLANEDDQAVNLEDFRGQPVIVYFYPRAMTPGCTVQACGMRDSLEEFNDIGVRILALSSDSPQRLRKFADKYQLNFTLLSDADHQVAESYGVWQLKKFIGKQYWGIVRTSFIIDSGGVIVGVVDKVKTKTHHQDILTLCKQIL